MKILVNPTDLRIEHPYEGQTYVLNPNSKAICEEKVAYGLQEIYGFLELEFVPKQTKGPSTIPFIEKTKTKSYIPKQTLPDIKGEDMQLVSTTEKNATLEPDGMPSGKFIDKDGVEWLGEGIEEENLTRKGSFH